MHWLGRIGLGLAVCGVLAYGTAAWTADEVVFGFIQPLTGQGAQVGQAVVKGADVAMDQVNKNGGVLGGKTLKYILEDDQCTPPQTVSAAKKLINQDQVKIVVGAMCSSSTLALMPVTQEAKVLQIVPLSYHPDITEKGHPSLFRTCITSTTNADSFTDFIARKMNVQSIALFVVNDDFGRGEVDVFTKKFQQFGHPKIVATEFFRFEDRDFSTYLTKIRAAKPEAIYIVARTPQNAMIINQMAEISFKPKIFGSGNFADVQFVDLVKKNGEGIYAITTWSKYLDNPTNRQYIAAYKAKYNEEPGTDYAQAGYNAIKVLADAINRAGSASDVAKLTEALRKTKVDITTGTLTFDSKGQGSVGVFPMKLENGEFRPVKS